MSISTDDNRQAASRDDVGSMCRREDAAKTWSPLTCGLVFAGIAFSSIADAMFLLPASGHADNAWILIVVTGVCVVIPCARSGWLGTAVVVLSAFHAAALFVVAENSDRTFFGGAVVPVLAGFLWCIVSAGGLVLTFIGWAVRYSRNAPAQHHGRRPRV